MMTGYHAALNDCFAISRQFSSNADTLAGGIAATEAARYAHIAVTEDLAISTNQPVRIGG